MYLYVKLKLKTKLQIKSNIVEVTEFRNELPTFVAHFDNQLKAHGLYDQFLAKTPAIEQDIPITSPFFDTSPLSKFD